MKKTFVGIILISLFLTGCGSKVTDNDATEVSTTNVSTEITSSILPSNWQKVEFISIGMLGEKKPRIQITNKEHVDKLYDLFSSTEYTEPGLAIEGFFYELYVTTSEGEFVIGIDNYPNVSVGEFRYESIGYKATGYKVTTNFEKELPALLKEWGYIDTLTP